VQGLNAQFVQMQAMQGAALVGREVAVEGDTLRVDETGKLGDGGFELASSADKVKVEMLGLGDKVIGTLELGAKGAGRHSFDWEVPDAYKNSEIKFRVTATSGETAVTSMPLAHQRIAAVSTFGSTFALELADGKRVAYDTVWAFL
jgi:flagellar basal-body rod modification protein FlgD